MILKSPMSLVLPMAIYGILTAPVVAAKCSDGLVNVVFNGPGDKPGLHNDSQFSTWFSKMPAASNWITFNFGHEYEKKIPMLFPSNDSVQEAVKLVNGPNPPDFILTFNEPDHDYNSSKVVLTPKEASDLIAPLLDATGNHTKLIAPVPAHQMSTWLPEFYGNCSCRDNFYAHNVHIYNQTADDAKTAINNFHDVYNDKPLWITEIAPRHPELNGCDNPKIPWDNSTAFMEDIFIWGQSTEWIHKIFWNSGNKLVIHCGDKNVVASWLLDNNGSPSPLLAPFNSLTCSPKD